MCARTRAPVLGEIPGGAGAACGAVAFGGLVTKGTETVK